MKKILLLLVAITLFLPTSVMASNLDCTSSSNGVVQVTLETFQGYVGAFDTTIQLYGDVTLESMEWDSSLLSSYVKKYVYDDVNKTIRIYIATGNMGRNLADQNGRIPLGTFTVKANQDGVLYHFDVQKLSVSNMDYESILASDFANDDYQEFVYQINSVYQEPDQEQEQEQGNIQRPSQGESSSDTQATDQETNLDSNFNEEDSTTDSNEPDGSYSGSDEVDSDSKNTVRNHWNFTILLTAIGVLVVVVGGIYFFIKRNKKNKE